MEAIKLHKTSLKKLDEIVEKILIQKWTTFAWVAAKKIERKNTPKVKPSETSQIKMAIFIFSL